MSGAPLRKTLSLDDALSNDGGICSTCGTLLRSSFVAPGELDAWTDFSIDVPTSAIWLQAKRGCQYCRLLYRIVCLGVTPRDAATGSEQRFWSRMNQNVEPLERSRTEQDMGMLVYRNRQKFAERKLAEDTDGSSSKAHNSVPSTVVSSPSLTNRHHRKSPRPSIAQLSPEPDLDDFVVVGATGSRASKNKSKKPEWRKPEWRKPGTQANATIQAWPFNRPRNARTDSDESTASVAAARIDDQEGQHEDDDPETVTLSFRKKCFDNISFSPQNQERIFVNVRASPGEKSIRFINAKPHKHIQPNSGSEHAFDIARDWISKCTNEHQMCNSLELGLLPTRVIEVMSAESDRVFLTETTNGQRGKYVALSYCWGQIQASKVFRLTPNNYYACKYNGIIISELPETIQDAIAIARGLAVPYLWVDSLCIIQEDAEDWPRESSTMGDTYSNAFLTIGADCAESATSKIIRNRQWSNLRYCQQFRLGPDCVHVQLKRSPGSDPDHIPAARAHFSKDAAPIHHRAWTFQEYLLSPRMLHYGPNEMTWECNEAWSCECGRVDENLASSSEYVHMSPMLHAVRTGRWNENCDLNSSYDLWDQCLENYTSRALTRETDKLPALSGFVKRVQDLTRHIHGEHDEYLAGLWRGNLPDGLLWEATTPASNRSKATMSGRRPRSYLAPSWSWASLNSPIRKSRTPDFKSKVDIRFVSTRPTTMDPTGQVSAGTLVLQGPLVRQMTLEQPVMQSDRWRLRRVGCPVVEFRPDDPSSLVHGRNTYAFLLIGHNEQLGLSYALILEQSRRDAYVFQRVGLCTQNQSLSTQMQRIRSEALQQLLAASEKEVVTIE